MAVGDYVTAQGLQIPTVEKLLDDLSAEQRATIDPLLNTDPDSPIGQLNGIFSSHLREAWEALRIAYTGFDPDAAEGALLEAICAITGTTRGASTRSKFVGTRKLKIHVDANKTINAGTFFHVNGDPTVKFYTTEQIVSTIAGFYYVAAECDQLGPVHCNATTLTVIATPVVGLNSVTNEYDAELGQAQDKDPQLRERREQELRATGSGTIDSLRADLLSITLDDGSKPILDVTMFENTSSVVDGNGLPPKSIEALVYDGVAQNCPDDTIAQVIWNGKAGGIEVIGTETGNAVDGLGNTRVVPFSRPTIQQIKYQVTLEIDVKTYAGDSVAKDAIIARFAKKVKPGGEIRTNDYVAALLSVAGVVDPTNVQMALLANPFPPHGTNIQLGTREMGDVDTNNIAITTIPVTP